MKIHVCPLCGEVADCSDDYGWSVVCTHPPYESIEPVEITGAIEDGRLVFPLPDAEEWKRTVGAEMVAKQEERDRKRAEWLALSCDERVTIRERRRQANPTAYMVDKVMKTTFVSMFDRYSKRITVPCPRCHDTGCENAYEKDNPHYEAFRDFWSGDYELRVEGG